MTDHPLPGKTRRETSEHLRDRGHRVAAIAAYRHIARRLEADPTYPLPADAEAVIAAAATAMQDGPVAGSADVEAYAAGRLAAIRAELAAWRSS
jgi:hypothetical protein